jgi:hypothetical protein
MQSPATKPKLKVSRLALCIGVGHYDNFKTLTAPPRDALAVASRLIDPQVGAFERVYLLIDGFTGQVTMDNQVPQISEDFVSVTTESIVSVLNYIFDEYLFDKDSLLVLFFAGHAALSTNKELYIFGADGKVNKNGKINTRSGLHLSQEFGNLLSFSSAPGQIVILLDACYAGAADNIWERILLNDNISSYFKQTYLLGAAQSDQEAGGSSEQGYFTQCLLEAFVTSVPTRGWITMRSIEENIAINLKRISNGKAQQLQGVNLFRTPIPLVKNPLFNLHLAEFANEVREILELNEGLRILPPIDHNQPAMVLLAEVKFNRRSYKEAFYCLDNTRLPVSIEDVERAAKFLKSLIDFGNHTLITRISLPKQFEMNGVNICPTLQFITVDELLGDSLDFTEYSESLVNRYLEGNLDQKLRFTTPPLGDVYIPLSGKEVELSQNRSYISDLRRGSNENTIYSGDLEKRVLKWIDGKLRTNKDIDNGMVIIGGYGTGKSSFCWHLAYTLITMKHKRQPIIIELKDFVGQDKLRLAGFLEVKLEEDGVKAIKIAKLKKWAELGRLVFIFDGFDEMASRSDERVKQRYIGWINEWASISNNKVLVTTRPEFFYDRYSEREIFDNWRRVYPYMLNPAQIEQYLKIRLNWYNQHEARRDEPQRRWQEYQKKIRETYDLRDLQRRFVLLELIIKTMPKYLDQKNGVEITRPQLYNDYLDIEINERLADKDLEALKIISTGQRLKMLEELAYRLYINNGTTQLNVRQFAGYQAQQWLDHLLDEKQRRELGKDWSAFLTYSFLIPVGEYEFEFSHKSFLEYLVAVRLAKQLRQNPPSFSGLELRRLTSTIADFLAELDPPMDLAIEAANKKSSSETLVYSVGQLRLSRRLYELAKPIIFERKQKEIGKSFVTRLEYYIFIQDKAEQGEYYYPDHWRNARFDADYGDHPLVGLTDLDAYEFCTWLNTRSEITQQNDDNFKEEGIEEIDKDKGKIFRLPTFDEAINDINLPYGIWYERSPYIELSYCTTVSFDHILYSLSLLSASQVMPKASYQAYEFSSVQKIIRALDLAPNSAHYIDLAHVLARALDRTSVRSRLRTLALELTRILVPARNTDGMSSSSLALRLAKHFNLLDVATMLKEQLLDKAVLSLESMQKSHTDNLILHRINLLQPIVKMIIAAKVQDLEKYRQSQREYVKHYALLVYPVIEEMEKETKEDYSELKRIITNLYWSARIAEARWSDPSFPVWEGLRIVCERVGNADKNEDNDETQ